MKAAARRTVQILLDLTDRTRACRALRVVRRELESVTAWVTEGSTPD